MNIIAEARIWYEGDESILRAMMQDTLLLPITFVGPELPGDMLFRENYFNSAARVRRGRLYKKASQRTWEAKNVSHVPYCVNGFAGDIAGSFSVNKSYAMVDFPVSAGWTAVLGKGEAQSRWVVVIAERAEDGYYLTLKSKTYFGVLPEVNRDTIPEANRQDILQALDAVVEAAPIQAPQPVIDACRNAAYHMITAKFPESNPKGGKDLGKLVAWLEREGRDKGKPGRKTCAEVASALVCMLDSYAGYLVNELHSRAKANAAAQHGTRPVSQQDANLAVDAIAFLLQDFGWARIPT